MYDPAGNTTSTVLSMQEAGNWGERVEISIVVV